jgi:hypothetical protein
MAMQKFRNGEVRTSIYPVKLTDGVSSLLSFDADGRLDWAWYKDRTGDVRN